MYHSPGLRDGVFQDRVRVCGPALPKSLEQNQYLLDLRWPGINSSGCGSPSLAGVVRENCLNGILARTQGTLFDLRGVGMFCE
jgi:hypothetical protein